MPDRRHGCALAVVSWGLWYLLKITKPPLLLALYQLASMGALCVALKSLFCELCARGLLFRAALLLINHPAACAAFKHLCISSGPQWEQQLNCLARGRSWGAWNVMPHEQGVKLGARAAECC